MKSFKIFTLTFFVFSLIFPSCTIIEPSTNEGEETIKYHQEDESMINGKLCCAANPLVPNDTILGLTNAYILFAMYEDDGYRSYVRDLFSNLEGELYESEHVQSYEAFFEFLPNKEICFYPVINGDFISLVDSVKSVLSDSIIFSNITLFTSHRGEDANKETHFYINDFVIFMGSDHKTPPFISDSITPSGEQIICFDAHKRPYYGGPFTNGQK